MITLSCGSMSKVDRISHYSVLLRCTFSLIYRPLRLTWVAVDSDEFRVSLTCWTFPSFSSSIAVYTIYLFIYPSIYEIYMAPLLRGATVSCPGENKRFKDLVKACIHDEGWMRPLHTIASQVNRRFIADSSANFSTATSSRMESIVPIHVA